MTPLRDGGARVDEEAIEPLVRFLIEGGVDGIFALGTTGEGVLLERPGAPHAAERFREVRAGKLIVHCGAQSTAETVALAAHAAAIGADGVAVIPPPYYPLGDDALVEHFVAAASACAPTPFYLYAFAARSGYPLPVAVVERVRERVENVAGLKVSDAPFERVQPYLGLGLPVYVGAERLIPRRSPPVRPALSRASRRPSPRWWPRWSQTRIAAGADRLEALRGADRALPVPDRAQAVLRARRRPDRDRCARPAARPAARPGRRGGRACDHAAGRRPGPVSSAADGPRPYRDRADAGVRLAEHLGAYAGRPAVVVLGLPRGGMPVAAEVARALRAPLDVFCVRKLGVPGDEELAMGAIATGGVVVVNDRVIAELGVSERTLAEVAATERAELERRERAYRGDRAATPLAGRTVVLVDDGLATGASMRAAVRAVRAAGPGRVVVAVPVAAAETCRALETDADEVVCALVPEGFRSVGGWYEDFSATSDDEVRRCLTS